MKRKLSWIEILVLCIGAVLGSLIARVTSGISFLAWLSFGDTFGVSPFTVDLGFVSFTFGLTIEITIAAIIGLILALIACKKWR